MKSVTYKGQKYVLADSGLGDKDGLRVYISKENKDIVVKSLNQSLLAIDKASGLLENSLENNYGAGNPKSDHPANQTLIKILLAWDKVYEALKNFDVGFTDISKLRGQSAFSSTKLSVEDLDKIEKFANGYGYLGSSTRKVSNWKRCCRYIIDKLDDMVVERANLKNWSKSDLAMFVDSQFGRHLGDELSSGSKNGVSSDDETNKLEITDEPTYLKYAEKTIQSYMNLFDKWAAGKGKPEYKEMEVEWNKNLKVKSPT